MEAGRRRVTAEIAAAYDAAIGTGGLLGQTLAGGPGRLVGRTAELARPHRLVVEVVAGRGRAVWVEGEPGIGKSALLAGGLAGAGPVGCRVLTAAVPVLRRSDTPARTSGPGWRAEASRSNVASPATLDRVVENCLSIRLGDRPLATEVYADLRTQVVRARERWYDANIAVTLAPWDEGPASGRSAMFVATVRYEYRVVPSSPVMRFSCASDLAEFRQQPQDPSIASAWYFEKLAGLAEATSTDAFDLVHSMWTANRGRPTGRPRSERRSSP